MSFTIDSLNGYGKGERYEKKLTFVNMFGNAKERSIVMKDEDGIELLWTTNDYTKAYKNFKAKGIYKFTVKYIINVENMNIPQINISHMKLDDNT